MAVPRGRPANRRRGEVSAVLGGEGRVLCLTLGALAELEDAFKVDSLSELVERFASGRLKANDLIRIVGAGLRGAGDTLDDEAVAGLTIDGGMDALIGLVADLLEATFGTPQDP
jgi:hypothetical protein